MAQTIQTLALNVRLSCQLLDVPESSYYERINRHPSKTQLRRQYLSLKISQLFNANRGIYGAPKIHHLLLKQGEKVDKRFWLSTHKTGKFGRWLGSLLSYDKEIAINVTLSERWPAK